MTHTSNRPPESVRDEGPSVASRIVFLLCLGFLVGSLLGPRPAAAQKTDGAEASTLIERYRKARHRTLARRHLQREGALPVYPLIRLPTLTDSLRPARPSQASATAREPSFPLHDIRRVRRLEQGWFREQFASTHWAFLGESTDHTFLDTTRTPRLRACLQAQFGDPTRTLADRPLEKPPDSRTQFEYWFVVNDSIPVQVMDGRGPKGRGLIVAVERAYRSQLRALRDTLLAPLRHSDPAPYVDYYHDTRRKRWYRTGHDGQSFFLEQIPAVNVVPGRRAHLDTVRSSESSSSVGGSSP